MFPIRSCFDLRGPRELDKISLISFRVMFLFPRLFSFVYSPNAFIISFQHRDIFRSDKKVDLVYEINYILPNKLLPTDKTSNEKMRCYLILNFFIANYHTL